MTEITERRPLMRRRPSGKFKMHDFQRTDIVSMMERDASANWSEMGAMKTTTAEWLWQAKLAHIPNPRVLVITTKNGKGTYFESLPETLPEWDVFTIGANRTAMVIGGKVVPVAVELPDPLYMKPVVVVAHYHCFTNRGCIPKQTLGANGLPVVNEDGTFDMTDGKHTHLLRRHWDYVLLDEAHRIKNYDAQWTRNIKKLRSQYRHAMTGTGFINNPAEIWSILNFLYPKDYTSYWKFREAYCEEDDYSGYRKVVGIKPEREDEFRQLVKRVGPRRTMIECFPNIHEPIETVVPVSLNSTQQQMYDEIKHELMTMDMNGTPLHSPNVLSALNRMRQICVATPEVMEDYYDAVNERRIIKVKLRDPSSKLDALMEVIEGLSWDHERKDQIVVFSNFKDPIELAKARFDKAGITYLHLKAGMSEKDSYEMWHDTWPKGEHQVFICTLQLGSESINLTSAHRCLFLDQSWSPKDNAQAIGRVYRPGQTGAVQLIYIRAENTVDYRILDANEEKLGWFRQIFGAGATEDDDNDVIEEEG